MAVEVISSTLHWLECPVPRHLSETSTQCWNNVGPASQTQAQHYSNNGSLCLRCGRPSEKKLDRRHRSVSLLKAVMTEPRDKIK